MPPIKTKSAKKEKAADPGRPVLYPEVEARLLSGADAMTHEQAKEFLGWEELGDEATDYLFTDYLKKKVRCSRNLGNRPFYETLAYAYAQELLMRRWSGPRGNGKTVNGESCIIGRTGEVISFQHRGVGLVLAEQIRSADPAKWRDMWPGPVVMDTVLVLGVDESDEVVNTVDTGRSRSEADMLYRSPYFADLPAADRRARSRSLAYAVKFLWLRLGLDKDALAPRRTHSELQDFIERHRRLVKCVSHVADENDKNAIGQFVSPGTASALMYLMGCSGSDPGKYQAKRDEKALTWEAWDKAEEFWALVPTGPDLQALRDKLAELTDTSTQDTEGGSVREKVAAVVKAWNEFAEGRPVTPASVKLEYAKDKQGFSHLAESPLLGGIDSGDPDDVEPTEAEKADIEARKDEARAAKEGGTAKAKTAPPASPVPPSADVRTVVSRLWEEHPGRVLLFNSKSGFVAFGRDATALAGLFGGKVKQRPDGLVSYLVPKDGFAGAVARLHVDGRKVSVVEPDDRGEVKAVREVTPPEPPKPRPAPGSGKKAPVPAKKGDKAAKLKEEQLSRIS